MTIQADPKFQEEYSAKLPVLTLLTNLGWSFLSPELALAARGARADEVVLRNALRGELQNAPLPLPVKATRCLKRLSTT